MPRVLCEDLPEHFCRAVSQMKWRGLSNGSLLARASEEFDAFITVDRNLRHQQNLQKFPLAVIVIHARSNEYEELRHFVTKIRTALETVTPGALIIIT
ncbi:MAG TPA: hypothetical protein VGF28_12020 [Thermoanaerobaculia bacterium]|jgi:hypothetical protein